MCMCRMSYVDVYMSCVAARCVYVLCDMAAEGSFDVYSCHVTFVCRPLLMCMCCMSYVDVYMSCVTWLLRSRLMCIGVM